MLYFRWGSTAHAGESMADRDDDFEKRMREREERRNRDVQAANTRAAAQDAVNDYLLQNSRGEFKKVTDAFPAIIERANAAIGDTPHKFQAGASNVPVFRGIVNAILFYSQAWSNQGPITVSLTIGARPVTPMMYVEVPEPKGCEFVPALAEKNGEKIIVWRGGPGTDMTSDELARFVVDQVDVFYDKMVRLRGGN